ncbi:MAG TPA: hypothetical protein VLI66_05220, partial [Terrabacter sp.]|nr:hypothetical protein [Terrabacter sp.]
ERSFANLGRRSVDALVFPDSVTAARGWARVQRYVGDGVARSIGLVARSQADLEWAAATTDVGYVEVRLLPSPTTDELLVQLAARGVTLVAGEGADGGPDGLPAWATAVLVTDLEPSAFDAAVTAVNR